MAPESISLSIVSAHQYGFAVLEGIKASKTCREGRLILHTLVSAHPESATPILGPRFGEFTQVTDQFQRHLVTDDLRLRSAQDELLGSDLVVVAGWPRLISATVLSALAQDRCMVVGMHPSPLPVGRGQSPVSWSILRGLSATALTVFDLEEGADTGNIRLRIPIELTGADSATSLYARVMQAHFAAGRELVDRYVSRSLTNASQEQSRVEVWPQLGAQQRTLSESMSTIEMERAVQAFAPPYDGAILPDGGLALWVCSSFPREPPAPSVEDGGNQLVACSDGWIVVKSVKYDSYYSIAKGAARMSESVLDTGLSNIEPDRGVDRRYAGVVLRNPDGRVYLQQRDKKPGIVNPGGVTLFGGVQEDGETSEECAIRELAEELCLEVQKSDLTYLGCADKLEEDGSTTRCFIYALEQVVGDGLILQEGESIVEGRPEELVTNDNVSAVCRLALRSIVER